MTKHRSMKLLLGGATLAIIVGLTASPSLRADRGVVTDIDLTAESMPLFAQGLGFDKLGGGDNLIINPPPPNISPTDAKAPDDELNN